MPVTVAYTTTQGLFQELFQLLGKAVQGDLVRQIEYLRVENQVLRSKLGQRVMVSPSELFGLHQAKDATVDTEGVVNRTVGGGEFFDRASIIGREQFGLFVWHDAPALGTQLGIDSTCSRGTLGFKHAEATGCFALSDVVWAT